MHKGKNVVITGATGMIGRLILGKCLEDKDVRSVTIFSRKSAGIKHPKLREVIHSDFMSYHNIEHYLRQQDIAYYCLGVYTGQVSREEFRRITVDYTLAFAEALKRNSPECVFIFLSGQGADRTGKSKLAFAKDKGIAENRLKDLQFSRVHFFRPSYIYPVKPRIEPNFSYRIMRWFYPLLKNVFPSMVITSEQLATAMYFSGHHSLIDSEIVNNTMIKKIARKFSG